MNRYVMVLRGGAATNKNHPQLRWICKSIAFTPGR